jgi:hypothetical protein
MYVPRERVAVDPVQCRCRNCLALFNIWQCEGWRNPDGTTGRMPARSTSVHHMDPTGQFCTLRCAAAAGVALRAAVLDVLECLNMTGRLYDDDECMSTLRDKVRP